MVKITIGILVVVILLITGSVVYIAVTSSQDGFCGANYDRRVKQQHKNTVLQSIQSTQKQENFCTNPKAFHTNDGDSGPLLEITPVKKCRLFPYLWSDECNELAKAGKLANNPYFCRGESIDDIPSGVFKGFKAHFEYTPDSDRNWKYTRCLEPVNPDMRPEVL